MLPVSEMHSSPLLPNQERLVSGITAWRNNGDPSWEDIEDIRDDAIRARRYCQELEEGKILFFRQPPFPLSRSDCEYLRQESTSGARLHKNISYRPGQDLLRGFKGSTEARLRTKQIMRDYSTQATEFVRRLLAPYTESMALDYASFRPVEEKDRDLPLHRRNDLLHIDAFPTRPTRGARILRLFSNIHPQRYRVWRVENSFRSLAERYAAAAGVHEIRDSAVKRAIVERLRAAGLSLRNRSSYDRFMLRFHNFLKENSAYQAHIHAKCIEFPPMSTWLVFTDGVAHAVISGQFALEQTFIVPVEALVAPEHSPLRILEGMTGLRLA
jgi:hypothetical protein